MAGCYNRTMWKCMLKTSELYDVCTGHCTSSFCNQLLNLWHDIFKSLKGNQIDSTLSCSWGLTLSASQKLSQQAASSKLKEVKDKIYMDYLLTAVKQGSFGLTCKSWRMVALLGVMLLGLPFANWSRADIWRSWGFERWVCSFKEATYELVLSWMLTENISINSISVTDGCIVILMLTTSGSSKALSTGLTHRRCQEETRNV